MDLEGLLDEALFARAALAAHEAGARHTTTTTRNGRPSKRVLSNNQQRHERPEMANRSRSRHAADSLDADDDGDAMREQDVPPFVSPYSFARFERPLAPPGEERPDVVAQLVAITYDEQPTREELIAYAQQQPEKGVPVHWYQAPVVRLAAVTADGRSLGINCYGMTPYCYLASSSHVARLSERDIVGDLQDQLDVFTRTHKLRAANVVRVEHVQLTDMDGYQPDGPSALLRVHMSAPSQIVTLRNLVFSHQPDGVLEHNFDDASKSRTLRTPGKMRVCDFEVPTRVWESNIKFSTRFQIDHEILELSWFRVPANRYVSAPGSFRCSQSVACDHSVLQWLGTQGDYARYAPMRFLSCDIETDYRVGQPKDQVSRVIQISCLLFSNHNGRSPLDPAQGGELADKAQVNLLFHLRRADKPSNVHKMYAYGERNTRDSPNCQAELDRAEREMLLDFARFIRTYDHDEWFWYNGDGFDLPTLQARAKHLGIEREFLDIGRLPGRLMRLKRSTFVSKARGERATFDVTVPLRINCDLLRVVHTEYKLRSYKLGKVVDEFWKDEKDPDKRPRKGDMPYEQIGPAFDGTSEDRRRLAEYAMMDSMLLPMILRKKLINDQYLAVARLTSVPVDALISQGSQAKVHTLLALFAKRNNYALPTLYWTPEQERQRDAKANDRTKGYQGATVLEPDRGFYDRNPVATLDYSGLYPSIMMAYNLCPTTLCPEAMAAELNARMPGSCVQCEETGAWFVQAALSKGVTPQILEQLTAARNAAKKLMEACEAAGDKDNESNWNVMQLAIKVIANSVYGFFGVLMGRFGYPMVAATVTAYGRRAIAVAKSTAESEEFRVIMRRHGIEDPRVCVIYGDTDSIMVQFQTLDGTVETHRALVMSTCTELAAAITAKVPKPMKIVLEKFYFPYLLIDPKRYAGMLWMAADKPKYLDVKGLEIRRRDAPPLVSRTMKQALDQLMTHRSVEGAVRVVQETVTALRMDTLPLQDYELTKSFGKSADKFDNELAQQVLWVHKRLEAELVGSGPLVGERVPFVIAADANEPRDSARAIDVEQMQRLGMRIDRVHYENQKLRYPVCNLLNIPLKGRAEELLFDNAAGQRYRHTLGARGIARFAQTAPAS